MTEDDYKTLQDGVNLFFDGINALWSILSKGIGNDKVENVGIENGYSDCRNYNVYIQGNVRVKRL